MDKLFAIVDMGTTNTRLTLIEPAGRVRYSAKGDFGVKDRAATGSGEILIERLNQLSEEIVKDKGVSIEQIELMICSGMITSEIGLVEIPHLTAPVDENDLAAHAQEYFLPEIIPCPIIFIPGVKNRVEYPSLDTLADMDFMRGEETQVYGALGLYNIEGPVTFMFLSSHTKVVDVDESNRITRSFTTLSGQIFDAFRFRTFLASSLPVKNPAIIHEQSLFHGIKAGLGDGILRASLMVRFMDTLIKSEPDQRFSFLEGIIIASDIQAMRNSYPFMRKRIAILGNRLRSEAYIEAFKSFFDNSHQYTYLGEDTMDKAALHGALRIANLRLKFLPDKQEV